MECEQEDVNTGSLVLGRCVRFANKGMVLSDEWMEVMFAQASSSCREQCMLIERQYFVANTRIDLEHPSSSVATISATMFILLQSKLAKYSTQ